MFFFIFFDGFIVFCFEIINSLFLTSVLFVHNSYGNLLIFRPVEQRNIFTWPEWCDSSINNEKWDGGSSSPSKKPEKGKSPSPALFDDPEGQPALPESLAAKCKTWKRIPELFANGGGTCVFEDSPGHGYKS